jgi:hypothetical protein
MIKEATVDAYGESEQVTGWFTMLENNLAVPFERRRSVRPSPSVYTTKSIGASLCSTAFSAVVSRAIARSGTRKRSCHLATRPTTTGPSVAAGRTVPNDANGSDEPSE